VNLKLSVVSRPWTHLHHVAALGLLGVAGAADATPPVLLAADAANARLLRLDPGSGAFTVIGPLGVSTVASLAYDSSRGILYATSTQTHQLLRIDPTTGATTVIGPLGATLMHGLEYNPSDDTLYGVAPTGPGPIATLYRVNPATGAATVIANVSTTGNFNLAYDSTVGVMYAAEIFSQNLYKLNLSTGAVTLIGSFGAPGMPFPQVGCGMAFDPVLGLFATDNTGIAGQANLLYKINTATGAATLVGITATANLLGLAFVPAPCYANCDASTSNPVLTANDFQCFLNRFAAGESYANCDGVGGLTANDFQCFLTAYAVGCS
jgi:hypothetical protein